jgi:hypothetical protein
MNVTHPMDQTACVVTGQPAPTYQEPSLVLVLKDFQEIQLGLASMLMNAKIQRLVDLEQLVRISQETTSVRALQELSQIQIPMSNAQKLSNVSKMMTVLVMLSVILKIRSVSVLSQMLAATADVS